MALNISGRFLIILLCTSIGALEVISAKCTFPAIFAFGDSNTDTGEAYAVTHTVLWPNGLTVGKLFKRLCDGRLIIDFLAESIGLPYLNASMDTNGTTFKYGANFAFVGQTINSSIGPWLYWPLDVQVSEFFDFKSHALASKEPESTNIYPKAEAFSDGLFIIDIGQNDVAKGYVEKNVSAIMNNFTTSVQRLLNSGAKYFWVHNTCPHGCLPGAIHNCEKHFKICTWDEYGCNVEFNNVSQTFNRHLEQTIIELRRQNPRAIITLVNMYEAKRYLITNNIEGFDNELKLKFCCGTDQDSCGPLTSRSVCSNPSKYLSWDGTHYTEAANRIVAKLIADGSYSEPHVAFPEACHYPY